MSTVKKGVLTGWVERAKHLRKYSKRFFWKRERLVVKEAMAGARPRL